MAGGGWPLLQELGSTVGFGAAAAEFLRMNDTLALLNLAWNNIRLGNAEELASRRADRPD